MSRTIRLTRELVDRLPARVDERGPMRAGAPDPDYYKRRASRILSEMQGPKELWVFAAGSLIWNRRFEAAERRPALDRGDKCEGIAIRM